MGDFTDQKQKQFLFRLFFTGAAVIKSCEKSRIFRYWLPLDFFSKGIEIKVKCILLGMFTLKQLTYIYINSKKNSINP